VARDIWKKPEIMVEQNLFLSSPQHYESLRMKPTDPKVRGSKYDEALCNNKARLYNSVVFPEAKFTLIEDSNNAW
jgi:hypothetical protein